MNNNLIFDVGMNNGDDTKYYLSLGHNVIAIDASPDLVKEAKKMFKSEILQKRLEVLNIGIATGEGLLDFYLNKHDSVWNSFDKNIGSRGGSGYETIQVKTESIARVVAEKGVPYYMKIDIEGYDKLCLQSLSSCKEKPKFISVELSEIDLISDLRELGYNKFKIIDQQSFLPLQLPPIKEYDSFTRLTDFKLSMNIFTRVVRKIFGKYIVRFYESKFKYLFKYNHPYGSSGPFAEGLAGKWLSFEEAAEVYLSYKSIHENSKRDVGYNYWIDIHATN